MRVILGRIGARIVAIPLTGGAGMLTSLVRADGILVPTTVTRPNNKPFNVAWLVTADAGGYRIADVVAEGMSLRLAQRSDYTSFLTRNNNDVDALIRALEAQVGRGAGLR